MTESGCTIEASQCSKPGHKGEHSNKDGQGKFSYKARNEEWS
jgi:hypothetical protein